MSDRPSPAPRKAVPGSPEDLLKTMTELRHKIRQANRAHGHTSLTLGITRLQLDKARRDRKIADATAQEQGDQARQMFYILRELMEIIRPGMTHGELDDDYKLTVAEIRRLRSVALMDEMKDETTIVAIQGDE